MVRKLTNTDLCILGKITRVESDSIFFKRLYPTHDSDSILGAKRPQLASWSVRSNGPLHEMKRRDPRLTFGLAVEESSKRLTAESVEIFFQTGLQYEVSFDSPKTLFSNKSIEDLHLEGVRISAQRVYLTFRDELDKVRERKTYRI